MVSPQLLQSIRKLSIRDKLSVLHAVTEMLQEEFAVNGQNGSQSDANILAPKQSAPAKHDKQDMAALVAELLNRPNPTPEQMLPYGIGQGQLNLTEDDFKIAEWHPTDEELDGF